MMSDDIYAMEGKRYTSQKKIGLYRTSGTASDWSATLKLLLPKQELRRKKAY